ncbi:hypothetical protein H5410_041329 [Solanum commersonii]|uniref:Uncharacterized protein n=1 Tax=Solanum commersonii TaxID=4109 RepID=A0A9J5XTB7_SOLCO|nr:hypothetical protein H5410_041329 [Solanum commersonii]
MLHKKILNFCPITSHKGEHLAECISNCLLDWNLDNVFTVTVDNASSNDVAILELSKKLDIKYAKGSKNQSSSSDLSDSSTCGLSQNVKTSPRVKTMKKDQWYKCEMYMFQLSAIGHFTEYCS